VGFLLLHAWMGGFRAAHFFVFFENKHVHFIKTLVRWTYDDEGQKYDYESFWRCFRASDWPQMGISPFREKETLKLRWEKVGPIGGRHFFEIDGVQYSAKQISPHLKDIQMHS